MKQEGVYKGAEGQRGKFCNHVVILKSENIEKYYI